MRAACRRCRRSPPPRSARWRGDAGAQMRRRAATHGHAVAAAAAAAADACCGAAASRLTIPLRRAAGRLVLVGEPGFPTARSSGSFAALSHEAERRAKRPKSRKRAPSGRRRAGSRCRRSKSCCFGRSRCSITVSSASSTIWATTARWCRRRAFPMGAARGACRKIAASSTI